MVIHQGSLKAGMMNDVKNLYQSNPDSYGECSWVEKVPNHLVAAGENEKTEKSALIVRYKKCYDGRKNLVLDSIIVQSPYIKTALGKILNDYPGVTPSLDRLIFEAPCAPFVHRWDNLVEFGTTEEDESIKKHTKLLHDTLKKELGDELKAVQDYLLNGVITFGTAWMIFEPGKIVYGLKDGQPIAAKLTRTKECTDCMGNRVLILTCEVVEWGGLTFGHYTDHFTITNFQGTSKITKLAYFPLVYHEKADQIKHQLIQRGKIFESLAGSQYKFYEGIAIGYGIYDNPVEYRVKSRIIVDTYAWNRFNPYRQVQIDPLGSQTNSDDSCSKTTGAVYENVRPLPLDASQHLICAPRVHGYSFLNKKWLTFAVPSISNITFSPCAFSSLVLPPGYKDLLLAFTTAKHEDASDDVISGKGRGTILLLSGPPGVGKTFTAECLAEHLRTPLYTISAGDLGTDPGDIESKLSDLLEMATRWNAILLLDEADVFFEQLSSRGLERKRLVSILLKVLEFYEGMLFLTTNRVGDIDAAFQPRIHVSMRYDELSQEAKKSIWNSLLETVTSTPKHHVAPIGFRDCDLDELAEYSMNGREIKNMVKTAQLLARYKGQALAMRHMQSVLSIEQRRAGPPEAV